MQLPLQNFRKNVHKSLIHMEAASPKTQNRHFGVELGGAGARSAEGTDIGHENAEGMAYVGVRVEPTVRLGTEVEGGSRHESFDWDLRRTA